MNIYRKQAIADDWKISTVHGLKYLSDVRLKTAERIFWAVALITMMFGFYFMIDETTQKFFSEKIVIKLSSQQYFIDEIPFPAVTICPEYRFSRHLPNYLMSLKRNSNLTNDELDLLLLLDMLYDQNLLKYLNISFSTRSIKRILSKYTQMTWFYENMAVYWILQYKAPFSKIVTKWGLCMNFNLMPAEQLLNTELVSKDFIYRHSSYESAYFEGLSNPMPWNVSHTESALTIFIDLIGRSIDYDDSNMFELFEGFRVFVHNTDEFPSSSTNSFYLTFLYYTEAMIKPSISLVDDSLHSMSYEKRNCFLPGEKVLKYFKVYSKNNCEQENLSLLLVKTCGCSSFHLIRSPDDKICGAFDETCRVRVENEFYSNRSNDCLVNCEVVNYDVKLIISDKANTVIDFSFENKFVYPLVKHRAYSFSEYVASFGGLLGLIAGISMISFIEFGHHMIRLITPRSLKVHPKSSERNLPKKAFQATETSLCQHVSKYFSEYMLTSSIHGFNYTTSKHLNVVEKLFWLICIVVSSFFCVILVKETAKNFELNPISFGIDSKVWSVKDIPFPTFTYCPKFDGKIYKSYHNCFYFSHYGFCKGVDIENMKKNFGGISFYCGFRKHYKYKKKFDVKIHPEDDLMSQLEHFIRYDWLKNQSFCYNRQSQVEMFPTLGANGLCFNLGANIKNLLRNEIVSRHFLSNNSIVGLCRIPEALSEEKSLSIDIQDENRENCNEIVETISMQEQTVLPTVGTIYLEKLSRMTLIITPTITTTDEVLKKLSPKIRNCYFPEEKHLRFFRNYNRENCYNECRSNSTLAVCGCVRFNDIRELLSQVLRIHLTESFQGDNDARICSYDDQECQEKVIKNMLVGTNHTYATCDCLPDCNSIEYKYELITDKITGENESIITTAQSYIDERIDSRLVVRFGSDEYITHKRYASYGTVELLSNIGGLLGLFLGISVLSLIEIIYYFTLRLINNLFSITNIRNFNFKARRNSRVIFL